MRLQLLRAQRTISRLVLAWNIIPAITQRMYLIQMATRLKWFTRPENSFVGLSIFNQETFEISYFCQCTCQIPDANYAVTATGDHLGFTAKKPKPIEFCWTASKFTSVTTRFY